MKTSWDRLLGYALLAALVVVTGCLLAMAKDMTAKEWVETGLPSWLQGLGTVLAAGFAWKAYRSWRDQEHAKRRADAAEKLFQAAVDTAESARDARSVRAFALDEAELEGVLLDMLVASATAPPSGAALERGAEAAGRLRTLAATAKLHFGPDVAKAALNIYYSREIVKNAFDALMKSKVVGVRGGAADELFGDEKESKLMNIKLLGLHLKGKEVDGRKDNFERGVDRSLEELEKSLSPHLSYQS